MADTNAKRTRTVFLLPCQVLSWLRLSMPIIVCPVPSHCLLRGGAFRSVGQEQLRGTSALLTEISHNSCREKVSRRTLTKQAKQSDICATHHDEEKGYGQDCVSTSEEEGLLQEQVGWRESWIQGDSEQYKKEGCCCSCYCWVVTYKDHCVLGDEIQG